MPHIRATQTELKAAEPSLPPLFHRSTDLRRDAGCWKRRARPYSGSTRRIKLVKSTSIRKCDIVPQPQHVELLQAITTGARIRTVLLQGSHWTAPTRLRGVVTKRREIYSGPNVRIHPLRSRIWGRLSSLKPYWVDAARGFAAKLDECERAAAGDVPVIAGSDSDLLGGFDECKRSLPLPLRERGGG